MSTSIIESSVVGVVSALASGKGLSLSPEQLREMAALVLEFITGRLDESAKADAARAGAEQASKVVDMESAEAAAKGRK